MRARTIFDEAKGRPNVLLTAVRELGAVIDLLGRLTGVFTPKRSVRG